MPVGDIELDLPGPIGVSFELEVSTNLVDWKPVTTAVIRDGSIRSSDKNQSSALQQFHRVIAR